MSLRQIHRSIQLRLLSLINIKKRVKHPRIFCLSAQKTGTTSVGDFYSNNGFAVSRWYHSDKENWSLKWYNGDFESIFSSHSFRRFQVFEDNPWWFPEFYKVLYYRFPSSKFILFHRDSDDWFKSMMNAHHGTTENVLSIHAKLYRRENEFYKKVKLRTDPKEKSAGLKNFLHLAPHAKHYKEIYETRNREIIEYFTSKDSDRLFVCNLYDRNKWNKLANFSNIIRSGTMDIHSNATELSER